MTHATRIPLSVDNDTPLRRRRQVAIPQAAIARAARVAESLGPAWHVEIEGTVIRLFQGAPPAAAVTGEAVAPEKAWRL